MERLVDYLVKVRDASAMMTEATNAFIETFAPKEEKKTKPTAAVIELTFTTLKFEPQQGVKLGEYEVAYKANNLEDKWRPAHSILRNSNATISDRYHGETYQYSYWLYGEDKIYRQKLKPKPPA